MEQETDYGCQSCDFWVTYKGYNFGCSLGVSLNERHMTNDGGWACEKYTAKELVRIEEQLAVLKEVAEEYSGKTIDNIIKQMEARIKHFEQDNEKVHRNKDGLCTANDRR